MFRRRRIGRLFLVSPISRVGEGNIRTLRLLVLVVMSVGLAGCAQIIVQPNRALLPPGQAYVYSDTDWATVLKSCVKDGLVDYDALSRNREPLERYYALLGVTGPTWTPKQFVTNAQATAYWINAYNALVLCAVMERYPVTTMYDLSMPRLTYEYNFIVDGRVCNLAFMEKEILKQSNGDVRALFATSRAALGTPPLSNEPMRSVTLERQLVAAAASALENPRLLRIDHVERSVFAWQLILHREEDFVDYWRKRRRTTASYLFKVLAELALPPQRRVLQSAVGYSLSQIPFDRTLNGCSPSHQRPVVP